MKPASALSLAAAALVAACASTATVPAGMKAGQFVEYACEGGKRLAARAAADGSTVRIRFEGGWELDRRDGGVYEGDGWRLSTGAGTAELAHGGKVVAKGCRATA
ncbi:hypothetical protein [Ramlibacter sp.]|uniref:hypothetical protein n=1 Tax=Ramlibacter sp. TaxID=1917967 RepID=UPI003D11D0E3